MFHRSSRLMNFFAHAKPQEFHVPYFISPPVLLNEMLTSSLIHKSEFAKC